jgi:protein-disulfide isomerase
MRRYIPFFIVAAVAAATIGGGTIFYRLQRVPIRTIPAELAAGRDRSETVHARGPTDATVILEEFGDFQCPPCAALAGPIKQLEKDYAKNLRVIFRDFPLAMHIHAREAAYAAEAAGLQGRFWEMHDLLYQQQAVWSKAVDARSLFKSYAGALALNVTRFSKDMDSDDVKTRVDTDQRRGTDLGVSVTPSIFVNQRTVPPSELNPDGLRAAIKEAMESKPSPSQSADAKAPRP